MSMMTNTLGRYFAGRFVVSAIGVFASIFVLLVLVDYIEMVRKTSGLVTASAITVAETSLFRVPQLLEKMMPFCILIGAMTCYLALSRRLELVVARAAGVSAWQFIAPALASAIVLGVLATGAKVGVLEDGGNEAVRALGVIQKDPKSTSEAIENQRKLVTWWENAKTTADTDKVLVKQASLEGGRMALKLTAAVPATMAVIYLLIILYFKTQGGYKAQILVSKREEAEMMSGGIEGPAEF